MNRALLRTKLKVSSLHFLCSVSVLATFILVLVRIWYPGFYFRLEDVWEILRIVLLVDIILGPFIMFLVFVPGKKGMKFDVVFILVVQIAFFAYAVTTFHANRPALLSFFQGVFYLSSQQVVETVGMDNYLEEVEGKYPKIRFVALPDEPLARAEVFKNMFRGVSVRYRPELQHDVKSNLDIILQYSLDVFATREGRQAAEQWLARHGGRREDFGWIELQSGKRSVVAVVDREEGEIEGVLWLAPGAFRYESSSVPSGGQHLPAVDNVTVPEHQEVPEL